MKVTVELEFESEAEAAAYLGTKAVTGKLAAPVAEVQQFEGTQHPVENTAAPMTPAQKAAATRAAKKAAENAAPATPPSTVPTSAFPAPPSQPMSPMPPQGVPMPGPQQVNYGAPAQAAPAVNAPPAYQQAPAPQAPVYQQAPAPAAPAPMQQPQAQAWDRTAVIQGIQATAENSGLAKATIQSIFGEIFNEQRIQPAPVGQLTDQDLYKFMTAFYPKIQAATGHNLA